MTELQNKTLSEIVTSNYQAARVLELHGLDFCCRGKRTLQDACAEKQLPMTSIVADLYNVLNAEDKSSDFRELSLTEMVEYIVRVHHTYVKLNSPQILGFTLKVATKHGDRFPYMKEVYTLFAELAEEMAEHMEKEEKVLFPKIKLLELNLPETNIRFLEAPIQVMEEEHERAGDIMEQIRLLSNNYSTPDQACTTFKVTLDSLKAFAADLHKHVHLENNILFPRTRALQASLT